MSETEKKFSEEITDFCVAVKITSGLPQLSASIAEVLDNTRAEYNMDDDEFSMNFTKGLMPKAKLTKLKQYSQNLRNWVKAAGFPRIEDGRGIDYLLMVEDISDAYAKETEIQTEMKLYVSDMVDDWDEYRNKIINSLGDIENPEKYFHYKTKDEYLRDFHLKMHIMPVSNATMIPAAIVDEEIRSKVEESINYQADFLLTRLEEMLADDLRQLHVRLLGTDSAVNSKTFNGIRLSLKKAQKFSLGRSSSIDRAVAGTEKLIDYLSGQPETLANMPTRRSCENTFNKLYSVLGAEEFKLVGEENDDQASA